MRMSSASPVSDRDRHPERRAKAEAPYPLEPLASGLVLDVGYERHPAVLDCVAQGREVVEGGFEAGRQDLGRRRARELEALIRARRQRIAVSAPKVAAASRADRRRRALDVVREKARSNPQDSVEPSAGFPLPLVQARTLECLTAEARSQDRDLLRIRMRRSALVEEQAQGTHRFPGNQQRHCDRAMRVQRQRRPVRKVAFERSRDRRPGSSFLRWPPARSAPAWRAEDETRARASSLQLEGPR